MKSINFLICFLMTVFFHQAFGQQEFHPLKIAELGCHRVDKLVIQNKIDKAYLNKFEKMEIKTIENDPNGANYLVIASQTAPTSGNALSLSLFYDAKGKILSHSVNSEGVAGPEVQWPKKDPITLTEISLHHILDEYGSNELLRPFVEEFRSLTIIQKEVDGNIVASITLTTLSSTAKLVMNLSLDGKMINQEILP